MAHVATKQAGQLTAPATSQPLRMVWIDAVGIVTIHVLALCAFLPWFFSWTGVVLVVLGIVVFGVLGINVCFHRLLTHRGFSCPKWFEHGLAVLGVCCLQDTPARWVATHRHHHVHADKQSDPHSPWVHFFWAHMGWMMFKNRELLRLTLCERYARDLLRDPFYARFENKPLWAYVVLASWMLYFVGGFIAKLLLGGSAYEALQFALSLLIWGVFVRTVLVWHASWSVNSVTHLWGYRNYETSESSRNNILIGILAAGEGWHNNHHAYPSSARHGHLWWEFDLSWQLIRLFRLMGLASAMVTPPLRAAVRPVAPRK
jgi:stearoyl-CoA desaturase (delta-9 desaturase)